MKLDFLSFLKRITNHPEAANLGVFFSYYSLENSIIQRDFLVVLAPIKQEYYCKFQLLFIRLIFSLKLDAYPGSISLFG